MDNGGLFFTHGNDFVYDFSVSAARGAWIGAAEAALLNSFVGGIFVDDFEGPL
jgi:hypothetical protein